MQRGILLFFLTFSFFMCVAQENNLEEFVNTQQEKLVYDESKLVQAPNTNVFLIPPEHFVADETINGFVHPGSATTIQIIEVPGNSLKMIDDAMTEEYISSQGYKFIERVEVVTEKQQNAVIYIVSFISNEVEYERAMFFTGDTGLIWINVNYPTTIKKLIFPAIEACLKSVQ